MAAINHSHCALWYEINTWVRSLNGESRKGAHTGTGKSIQNSSRIVSRALRFFRFPPRPEKDAKNHAAMHYTPRILLPPIESVDRNLAVRSVTLGIFIMPDSKDTRGGPRGHSRSCWLTRHQTYSWFFVCPCSEKLQDPRLTVQEYRLHIRAHAHKI